MVWLTKIRDLDVATATAPDRPLHLSAASGLVCAGRRLYVVADDELHLGVFDAESAEPGHLIRLFDGALPDTKKKRKKRKPDLETLTRLPPFDGHPHGALLALGSGSRPNRRMGALLQFDALDEVAGDVRAVDFSSMLTLLDREFDALNIEGAIVTGQEFWLLQRGNKSGRNAVIRYALAPILAALTQGEEQISAIEPLAISEIDIADIDGIPLGFTDGASLPYGRVVFSAVAEDTDDAYADGRCAGAALGILDDGGVQALQPLDRPWKVEGVSAQAHAGAIDLLLVTDDDDAAIPAGLFSARLEA